MTDYEPIACGLHELYQYAVMKRRWLDLVWLDEQGGRHAARVLPTDVLTLAGAEYIHFKRLDKQAHEIRLDRIISARWAYDGSALF